jgi:hypothetical protein
MPYSEFRTTVYLSPLRPGTLPPLCEGSKMPPTIAGNTVFDNVNMGRRGRKVAKSGGYSRMKTAAVDPSPSYRKGE